MQTKHYGPLGDITAFPKNSIIVEIDENGTILGSLHSEKGGVSWHIKYLTRIIFWLYKQVILMISLSTQISYISEMGIGEKYTYFGSPYTSQLWRIKTEML